MIENERYNELFKYFKPGFKIEKYKDGILVSYFLTYKTFDDYDNVIAIFHAEYIDLNNYKKTILQDINYLKPDVAIDDLIEYIKVNQKEEFNKEYNEIQNAVIEERNKNKTKIFKKLVDNFSSYTILDETNKLSNNNLARVEYHFSVIVDVEVKLKLKVGIDKFYSVPNISRFFEAIKCSETLDYGRNLRFCHRIDNFCVEDRNTLEILLSYAESYCAYKELDISYSAFHLIFESLKGRYIYINDELYLVRLNNIDVKVNVDKDYYLHTSLPANSFLMDSPQSLYLFNTDTKMIDAVLGESTHRNLVSVVHDFENFNIKKVLKFFKEKLYMNYYDQIEIDLEIVDKFDLNFIDIYAYFDYDNGNITLRTEYKKDNLPFDINDLKDYYDIRKCEKYFEYISSLGFVNNVIKDSNAIYRFFTIDFSSLRKICRVFLSENITSKQVVQFKVPTIKVQYQNNLLSFLLENSSYSDDELYNILKAIRKKQKYLLLNKDTIIDLDNNNATKFNEFVEDLNDKELSKKIEKPLYQSFKLQNYADNITLDNHVQTIIDEIAHFKEANISLPNINATLRPYQIEGFYWLKILSKYHLGGILADDMGLGKTLEIITLIKSDETKMPSLIICPKSLIFNWHSEFEKFDGETKIVEIYGLQTERKKIIQNIKQNEKVIYITSYDVLRNDNEIRDKQFNYMIIDEGQYIKNIHAQKTKSVKELNAIHKFALTGTPIENNIFDLWSLFDFIMPEYLADISTFKEKANDDNYIQTIAKKIAPFILRRTKQEVLSDLPSKYERIVTTELTKEQQKLYDAYVLKAKDSLNNDHQMISVLSIITRLRQICVDPNTFVDNYEGNSGKIDTLMELIDEYKNNNHRLLVFSQFVSALDIIERKLQEKGIHYYKLTGETNAKDRISLANDFNNNDDIKVFLISLKAGGTGLNLIGADTIIHLDPWWNVSAENQATDRSHRIGQTQTVEVIKLICKDTIEQRVIELQNIKKDLIDKLISNDDSSITKLSKDDLNFILS